MAISARRNREVVEHLCSKGHSMAASRAWALMMERDEQGQPSITRAELAAAMQVHRDLVSEIMGRLTALGAVTRHRTRVKGLQGPGIVSYALVPQRTRRK